MSVLGNDTICAISTPQGVGGIAVIRVSGEEALHICSRLWHGKDLREVESHTVHLGTLIDEKGSPLDQAVAAVFRNPGSFTGEDVVEFSVHGSRYIQQALLNSLISAGARLAEPGEFTRRAFASGKLDLAQAEAVADLISSQSSAAHRIAMNQMRGGFSNRLKELRDKLLQLTSLLELELDFSEEEVEFASRVELTNIANEVKTEVERLAKSFHAGRAIKEGIPVAIVGATNAGKSSLLNALLEDDRAIVSDVHGTTRDIVEDTITLGDYTFRLMDTAGLRSTSDEIENMGIERSRKAAAAADIIISLVDVSDPHPVDLPATDAKIINVYNKIDKITPSELSHHTFFDNGADHSDNLSTDNSECISESSTLPASGCKTSPVLISAINGEGIEKLKNQMIEIARQSESNGASVMVTNARHLQALLNAKESIIRAIEALEASLSGELVSQDIRLTIHHLSSILGDITSSDILKNIFSRFCIGK